MDFKKTYCIFRDKGDRMYKVLIAEDEMLVRVGLKNAINWEKFGMMVYADVADGRSAWEIILRETPDLLITDIRMPVMDGMELIGKIRENGLKTKIIILTCMEEFDLAQKAINFGVSNYILKLTMTFQDIEAIIIKVADELEERIHFHSDLSLEKADINILKQNCLRDFILDGNFGEAEFIADIRKLRICLRPEKLVVCAMVIDHFDKYKLLLQSRDAQLAGLSLLDVINGILGDCGRGEMFIATESKYVFIFSFYDKTDESEIHEELKNILARLRNITKDYFNLSLTLGISKIHSGYGNLNRLYTEADSAAEMKFFAEPGKNLWFDTNQEAAYVENAKKLIKDLVNELGYSEIPRDSSIRKRCAYMDYAVQNGFAAKGRYLQILMDIISHMVSALPEALLPKILFPALESIRGCESLQEAIDLVHSFDWQIRELKDKGRMLSGEVSEAIKFISQNFDQDITLQHISEVVGLSSNYLCSLFRKELGIGINEYLIQVRIDKAKKLLLETNLKSYQIADKTGFTDTAYFSRLFKKVTGVNPNEFRKKLLIPEQGAL